MKKQKMLMLVIGIVVLLAGGYGIFKWQEYAKTEILETVDTVLCDIETNDVERIELKMEETITFVKSGAGWAREDKEALLYDQELMNTLIGDLTGAVSHEMVSNVQDMSAYGIDEQAPMATLYGKSGKVQTLRIGKEVTGMDATYVSKDDNDDEVFAVDNKKLGFIRRDPNGFIKKSLRLNAIEQLQTFEVIYKGNTTLKVNRNPQIGSEGFEKWILVAPFERAHEMNTEAMNQMILGMQAFTKDYYVADLTDENKVKYGLNEPLLRLKLNETEEVVFGQSQNDMIYFYTSNEPYIYQMPMSKIAGFESIEAFDLIRKQIYIPNKQKISEVQVTYGKEVVSIKWAVDEKNPQQKITYVNDQVVSEEVAKSLIDDVASLSLHSKLVNAELERNQEREAEVVIRYLFNDHSVKTIELRPFDPSYYVLKDNGTIEFVVEKKQFITIWNKLQKAKEIS